MCAPSLLQSIRRYTLLAALLAALSCQSMDPVAQSQRDLERAIAADASGDHDAGLRALRSANFHRAGHPGLLRLQARAEVKVGDLDAALDTLRRVEELGYGFDPDQDPELAALEYWPGYSVVAERLRANAAPLGHTDVFLQAGEAPFLPEGVAHDPITDAWFLGSVHQRRILRIVDGKSTVFADADDGLLGAFGMAVDPTGRRLWVCSAGDPVVAGLSPQEKRQTALLAFDLDSGEPIGRWQPESKGEHHFGDLWVSPEGEVFVSDSAEGAVYRLRRKGRVLERCATSIRLHSPQGLAGLGESGDLLLADYPSGLWRVDPKRRQLTPVAGPAGVCLFGIDGLCATEGGWIAIQNGFRPPRILRLTWDPLTASIGQVEVLAAGLPSWNEPTLGLVRDQRFYFVANSCWPDFSAEGQPQGEQTRPEIQCLDLR